MEVEIIRENKKRFLDLLLLADEQESMIDKYLERGEMFALYDGDLKNQAESFGSLGLAMLAGIIFVYMIMVALYDSYVYPFVVLFSIPVAMVGAPHSRKNPTIGQSNAYPH